MTTSKGSARSHGSEERLPLLVTVTLIRHLLFIVRPPYVYPTLRVLLEH